MRLPQKLRRSEPLHGDDLPSLGNAGGTESLGRDPGRQGILCAWLAMHQKLLAYRAVRSSALDVAQQLALVGVGAEAVQDHDLGRQVALDAEDADPGPALHEPPSE